jgi:predicted phosphate transport protein (TIGR00153 family)
MGSWDAREAVGRSIDRLRQLRSRALMGFAAVLRFFVPKADHFYGFLERQAVVAHEGAVALATFVEGNGPKVRDAVQSREHEGDRIVHEMEEALARTFVTPIDREDLHSLSTTIDDILDLTNGAARACSLFGVERPSDAMVKLMAILVRCTQLLEAVMPKLRKHAYAEIIGDVKEMKAFEKEADQVYRNAVSALFLDPAIDAKALLREKGVLEDLENAIDSCEDAAERLTNLAVKHG